MERLHKVGLCAKHHAEWEAGLVGAPPKPICTSPAPKAPKVQRAQRVDCEAQECALERMASQVWCRRHWLQVRRHGFVSDGLVCSTKECTRAFYGDGLCRSCYKKREYALLHGTAPIPVVTEEDYFQALRDALHPSHA